MGSSLLALEVIKGDKMNQLMVDIKKDVTNNLYKSLVSMGDEVKHLGILAANRFPASEKMRKQA